MQQKVAYIGLGKMGSAMAEKILEACGSLIVYNRTPEKAKRLVALGAELALSPELAVKDVDIIFSCVFDDAALLNISETILPNLKEGAIHVSTSTVLPNTAKELDEKHKQFGCFYIAAPVLGVPKVVSDGKATTFCAGDSESVDKILPIINQYSINVENLGTNVEHANVLKICMNYTLVNAIELISELYAFAEKSGVNSEVIQNLLHHVYSHPAIKLYVDKIQQRNFDDVNFDIRGGIKDVNLFQQAFSNVGVIPDIAKYTHRNSRCEYKESICKDKLSAFIVQQCVRFAKLGQKN